MKKVPYSGPTNIWCHSAKLSSLGKPSPGFCICLVTSTVERRLTERQISEPTFSSFYIQTMKNQQLLHAIKYCILYVLYYIVMVTLS